MFHFFLEEVTAVMFKAVMIDFFTEAAESTVTDRLVIKMSSMKGILETDITADGFNELIICKIH